MNNYLYHFTSKLKLRSILKDNKLKGSHLYDNTVSLTRNRYLNKQSTYSHLRDANAIIVLDRDKLKTRYKLNCYNYYPSITRKECEEIVLGDIEELSKYIVEIIKL